MDETIATNCDDSIELALDNLAVCDFMSVVRVLRLYQAVLNMSLIK